MMGTSVTMGSADTSLWVDVQRLQAEVAAVLDAGDWDRWPGFFVEDGSYVLQPRENHARGLPLATMRLESRGMMHDRVYGIRETLYHDPYYQRHVVGITRILGVVGEGSGTRIRTEANYLVIRTKLDRCSEVFSAGRYLDEIVRTPDGLRFASRLVVFDSELIPNSIIYPI